MKKLLAYFNPHNEVSFYKQKSGNAFVVANLVLFILTILIGFFYILFPNENFSITIISVVVFLFFSIFSLFLIRKKGITIAGNVFSIAIVVIICIFLNIIDKNASAIYKFIQGFYDAFVFIAVGALFASRKILIINTFLVFLSALRVYIYGIRHEPENEVLLNTAFIQYSLMLIGGAFVFYYILKFSEDSIKAANEDARIKEQQNQELLTSEEELRASNEELVTTTDALRESYEALEHAKDRAEESNRLKSIFLSNISHEVRTPMNGIIGFSKLLTIEGIEEEEKKNFSKVIVKSSEQLLKIIEDIIEVSLLETKKVDIELTKVNLQNFLQNMIGIFELKNVNENLEVKLETNFDKNKGLIFVDEKRLFKILSNLVENAMKFTQKGFVKVICNLIGAKIEFKIQDTGIGMDKECTLDIFDRFVQADENISKDFGGLGLGLAIAKENTELLGGKLLVESKKNHGSTFSFEIDYQPAGEHHDEDKAIQKKEGSIEFTKTYKLLVAEDEEVNFCYLKKSLQLINDKIKLYHARNGQEAVAICQKEKPDLILMDIKMPILNGLEATKAIKKELPDLKIIAQTAYSTEEEQEKTLAAGCDDFITKPISFDTLKETLNKYLI